MGHQAAGDRRAPALAAAATTKPIEMPRNSPTGFVVAFFAVVTGFALIWHIWWMAAVGIAGAFATFVVFAWRDHDEYELPAEEVARIDALTARGARRAGRGPRARHPVW